MRPLRLINKYMASTGNIYRKGETYQKIDTVNDYRLAWKSGEVAGEYKYKIYFYEGEETDNYGVKFGCQYWFKDGVNHNQVRLSNGKLYTRGQYCDYLNTFIDKFNNYGFGFTVKFVGYEIKKDSIHQKQKNPDDDDLYGYYERGKTITTGLDIDDRTTIRSNYSDHHHSIMITYGSKQVGGVPWAVNHDSEWVIGTSHYNFQEIWGISQIEHEFMHCLWFGHTLDYSVATSDNLITENAPAWQGIILSSKTEFGHEAFTQLGLNEDGIHGIDTLYNVSKSYHLKIKGTVNSSDIGIAEDYRDPKYGTRTYNSFGYLGYSHAFFVESGSNEIYYQSPIDTTGYFEFRIRVPNKYISVLNNRKFYIFIVSSHFSINYAHVVRPKGALASQDKGVPIFWGKSDLIDLSGTILPYTYTISTPVRVNNQTYPTKYKEFSSSIGWSTNVFDLLKSDSGVITAYAKYRY